MNLDGTSLITGGLGQDGFILCRRLLAITAPYPRAKVIALVRPNGQNTIRQDALVKLGCQIIELDVCNVTALEELVAELKPKHIFHLAATHYSSQAGPETDQVLQSMRAVNVLATKALAQAVLRTGIGSTFIYASSSQIWTPRELGHRVDETTPVEPATFYGATKVAATDLLRQYRNQDGLHASVAILFNHESSLRSPHFVTRKVTIAAARAAIGATEKLRLINLGTCVDWQAASDVVEGLLLMANSNVPDDYVLASGHGRSIRDLLDIAFGHVGLDWREYVAAGQDEVCPFLLGTPDKAARTLGWQAQYTFEDLIVNMVETDAARLRGEILP